MIPCAQNPLNCDLFSHVSRVNHSANARHLLLGGLAARGLPRPCDWRVRQVRAVAAAARFSHGRVWVPRVPVAPIFVNNPPAFSSKAPGAIAASAFGAAAPALSVAIDSSPRVLIARERKQRHGQHNGAHKCEKRNHDGQAHGRCMPGDAHKRRGGSPGASGCLAEQDHAGDAGRDVESKHKAGKSCVRRASHGCSRMADAGEPCWSVYRSRFVTLITVTSPKP